MISSIVRAGRSVNLHERPTFDSSVFKYIRISVVLIIVKYSLELIVSNFIDFLNLLVILSVNFRLRRLKLLITND
jgi:hypothetical protein